MDSLLARLVDQLLAALVGVVNAKLMSVPLDLVGLVLAGVKEVLLAGVTRQLLAALVDVDWLLIALVGLMTTQVMDGLLGNVMNGYVMGELVAPFTSYLTRHFLYTRIAMETKGQPIADDDKRAANPGSTLGDGASVERGEVSQLKSTHRGLKSRHVQLVALGGTIGTGLFVGSGAALATCGPAPLLMSYSIMSLLLWIIMMDLGEMTAWMPVHGLTVPYMVERFVDPSLAFATGWTYWFSFSVTPAAEATINALLFEYWTNAVPSAVWIAIVLGTMLALNISAVKLFGEAEFWFASIKIITIIGLIIMGFVLMLGGGPKHDRLGFKYWDHPGAFHDYLVPGPGISGRFLAFWYAMIRAGFAFVGSPELITATAGECQAPRRNIPKAARRFIYRLLVFYILGALVVGAVVPYNESHLLGSTSASASPFVIGIKNAGVQGLDHAVNFAIITSAWSAGNASVYAGSRMLYGLAMRGSAPKVFSICNRRGVPYNAVVVTWLMGLLAFLDVSSSGANVFTWLSSIITVSGLINWMVVLFTYTTFRKATMRNDMRHLLPVQSVVQPYSTWFVMVMIGAIILTNGFSNFFPGKWSTADFVSSYVCIPIFIVLYSGHKLRFKGPLRLKIEDIDVMSGLEEVENTTLNDVRPEPKNVAQRLWFWIC